jgi:hypothetical protein
MTKTTVGPCAATRRYKEVHRSIIGLLGGLGAAAVLFSASAAGVAAGNGNPAIGTYTVSDHGQGGWTGGPLFADHTLGGAGSISFSTPDGQVVYLIQPIDWSWADSQDVTLNFNNVLQQGPAVFGTSFPLSLTLPVSGTPLDVCVQAPNIGCTTLRVTIG